tara:strand:- start:27278 stop:28258 length:981 start_codon:yes stop_codon:yes gene_type:complete
MALFSVDNVRIAGISAAIPKIEVRNQFSPLFEKNEATQFINTTGIDSRRISGRNLKASDLCTASASKLIADLNWNVNDIDILIFVSQTPDQTIPGTSTSIQHKLGLPNTCMSVDINQGCSGYVYGLSILANLLSPQLKKGLLLVGDTITDLLDPIDKSVIPVFSDAGTATAMEYCTEASSMYFNLQSDGSGKSAIEQKPGEFMKMKGLEVFNFGLREVAPNIEALSSFSKTPLSSIDYLLLHQANLLLNESIRKKLGISKDKTPYSLNKYGNTSNASIALTFVNSFHETTDMNNGLYCFSGFGVGLLWGSCILQISDIVCSNIIEL